MNVHALIVAAGSGSRFGGETPKQYLPILGNEKDPKCVLQYSVQALARHSDIDNCTLVVAKNDDRAGVLDFALPVRLVAGGMHRWQSVANGVQKIAKIADPKDLVLIHDAARPCLRLQDLTAVIEVAKQERFGAILGVPVVDTLKSSTLLENVPYVNQTLARDGLWQAQTPQVYRLDKLLKVMEFIRKNQRPVKRKLTSCQMAENDTSAKNLMPKSPFCLTQSGGVRLRKLPPLTITDEAMGFEAMGFPIRLVMGSTSNIKLTYPSDRVIVEALLRAGSL